MKTYNRAKIIRNSKSIHMLKLNSVNKEAQYWLLDSEETFHGVYDSKYFYFEDSRIPNGMKLPLNCVELEFE